MQRVAMPFLTAVLLYFGLGQTPAAGPLNKSPAFHIARGNSSLDVIIDRGIIHFTDADPASTLEQRIGALRSLLNTYFLDHPRGPKHSFTFGQYDELNVRMASAARCSRQWDFQTGRAPVGNSANWLRQRLNDEKAYGELIPVFDEMGYQIDIAAMESISLCGPAEVGWTSAVHSCENSIPPQAKLPCGALLTFSLRAR